MLAIRLAFLLGFGAALGVELARSVASGLDAAVERGLIRAGLVGA